MLNNNFKTWSEGLQKYKIFDIGDVFFNWTDVCHRPPAQLLYNKGDKRHDHELLKSALADNPKESIETIGMYSAVQDAIKKDLLLKDPALDEKLINDNCKKIKNTLNKPAWGNVEWLNNSKSLTLGFNLKKDKKIISVIYHKADLTFNNGEWHEFIRALITLIVIKNNKGSFVSRKMLERL